MSPKQSTKPTNTELVAANTLILELHIRGPMFSGRVDSKRILQRGSDSADNTNGEINPDRIHISKDLVDQSELKALRDLKSQFTTKLKSFYTLPTGMLAHGLYRISTLDGNIDRVDAAVEEFVTQRRNLLEELRAKWPSLIEKAQKDLGPEFNAADYPSFDTIVEAHRVEWNYFSADIPARMEELSRDVYQRETQKREVELRRAYDEIEAGLIVGFQSLVDTFNRQLGKDSATGKRRKLFDSTLEKFNLFFETFSARNGVVGNDQLAELVKAAKDIINGRDIKTIKGSDSLRDSMQSRFATLGDAVAGMVEVKSRRISLDEDV